MHKSKLYDMAAQIAVDKLVPKPVHITISMQGGGGLSNIELPVIKRVSGGDIGDTGEFIGGYTDAYAGVDYNERTDDEPAIVRPAGVRVTPRPSESPRGEGWEPLLPQPDVSDTPMQGIPRLDKSPEQRMWDELGIWRGMGRSPGAMGGINRLDPQLDDWWPYRYDDVISDEEFMRGVHHTQEHFNKPFYDRVKEGPTQTPDYNTEADVIDKIRAGHQDFLTPKEKEVWDRMQGIIGEDDSYLVEPVSKQVLDKILDPLGGRVDVMNMRNRPRYHMERYRKPGYVRPSKAASGGGISDLNDSININGQPHRLVWANPQEERVLKKMGGSGKKVLGKPAYFDEWSFAETVEDLHGPSPTTQSYTEPSEYEYLTSEESYPDEPAMTYPSRIDTLEREVARTEAQPHLGTGHLGVNSEMIRDLMARDNASYDQVISRLSGTQPSLRMIGARQVEGLPWLADKNIPAARQSYNLVGDLPKKGFLGLTGDPMNMSEAIEGAYKSGFAKWRAGIGMYEADAPKAYNEWFAKQNPEDLVEGYKYGDPVGHSTRSAMNRVTKQLKNKFTAARDLASVGQEDEEPYKMTRKDYQEVANEIKDIEDFTPYDGILPAWMPGWMKAGAGFFSRTVIGTGKVGGVPVHIHEDGTVTAISPEDSPGYDHELHHEPGGEVARRYRPRPVEQASISETIEEEPTGIAKVLASRSKPSTLAQLNEEMQERVNRLYNRNIFT
jgi:hypothetical protein